MTQLLTEKQLNIAAQIIKAGGLVAFRTETVYGLGADADNSEAVKKIYAAKNRPQEKQLVMQFASLKDLKEHFPNIVDTTTQKIFKKFKVGLTVVLPNDIAVRIPADKFAKKFLRACGVPLVVPSANTSGAPPPTTWNAVYDDLNGRIDAILMSKPCKLGVPSTIIKIENGKVKILREGAIPAYKLMCLTKS